MEVELWVGLYSSNSNKNMPVFSINSQTGQIKTSGRGSLDFEMISLYTIEVTAFDHGEKFYGGIVNKTINGFTCQNASKLSVLGPPATEVPGPQNGKFLTVCLPNYFEICRFGYCTTAGVLTFCQNLSRQTNTSARRGERARRTLNLRRTHRLMLSSVPDTEICGTHMNSQTSDSILNHHD